MVVLALKLKAGSVAFGIQRIDALFSAGRELASKASVLSQRLGEQLKRLVGQSTTIRKRFTLIPPPSGMWLHPRNLLQGFLLTSKLKSQKMSPITSKRPNKTLRLAERLGLVPPLLKKLAPLGSLAQAALRTAKHLRR